MNPRERAPPSVTLGGRFHCGSYLKMTLSIHLYLCVQPVSTITIPFFLQCRCQFLLVAFYMSINLENSTIVIKGVPLCRQNVHTMQHVSDTVGPQATTTLLMSCCGPGTCTPDTATMKSACEPSPTAQRESQPAPIRCDEPSATIERAFNTIPSCKDWEQLSEGEQALAFQLGFTDARISNLVTWRTKLEEDPEASPDEVQSAREAVYQYIVDRFRQEASLPE